MEVLYNGSFGNLVDEAQCIKEHSEDFMLPVDNVRDAFFDAEQCKLVYTANEILRKKPLTDFALSQLCSKIGVPVRYINACLENRKFNLAEKNINAWLSSYGKGLFIRECYDKIRGILSNRYSVLDVPDILEVLSDVPFDEVRGYFIDPERFSVRLVQSEKMNIAGEDLFAGIEVDSSDVGRSALSVRFFIYKFACSNGLVITKGGGNLFQQRHIGITSDEFRFALNDSLLRIPALIENAEELINAAAGKRLSSEEFDIFYNAIKQRTGISNDSFKKVVELTYNKYGDTKWGLINSLTEVAQEYTLERRIELERAAGEMLFVA